MNTLQRLLSNTLFAFISNIVIRASNSVLFILIGRVLGPADSGVFSLGITFFTIVFGLSAWGLQELLVREVAPRREESGRYLANYLFLRLLFTVVTYLLLVAALRYWLPYEPATSRVILVLTLAVFPEAIFGLCQSLFEAYEQLFVPALAALVTSAIKIGGGFWLLRQGASVGELAWVLPVASLLGVLLFGPALPRLLRRTRQKAPARIDISFSLIQFRQTPGFFVIHLFSVLDYQADALLISLLLAERELGWYAAAQTILLGFSLMPVAVRAALYPLMARYHHESPAKLAVLHQKANQYVMALVLPLATGVGLLALPIIRLIFGADFEAAVPALQWSIGALVFVFLNVPNARLLMVNGRQREASIITGISMAANITLNLLLIPVFGIVGAALSRLAASFLFFLCIHLYVHRRILANRFLPLLPRPMLATLAMAAAVWPLRHFALPVPVLAGILVYGAAAALLRVIPRQDLIYWQQLYRTR
jgi:O-antigen/teichoic acid export membrane protein